MPTLSLMILLHLSKARRFNMNKTEKDSLKADIKQLKIMPKEISSDIDLSPIIVYVMRYCGCSFSQIGEVFGYSRQRAFEVFKKIEKELEVKS